MAITNKQAIRLADKITAGYLAAKGDYTADTGLGVYSAAASTAIESSEVKKARQLLSIINGDTYGAFTPDANLGLRDSAVIAAMAPAAKNLVDSLGIRKYASKYSPVLAAINQLCRDAGLANVNSLNDFLSYYNTTNLPSTHSAYVWEALVHPSFAELCSYALGMTISPHNVYFEVLQGSTYTLGLGRYVTSGAATGTFTGAQESNFVSNATATLESGTFPVGNTTLGLDSSLYAGGFAYLKASASVAGTFTVYGVWRNPVTGGLQYGAGTVTGISGSGSYLITPPVANGLLIQVTSITYASGETGKTVYINAVMPTLLPSDSGATGASGSSRTNPPT